MGACRAVLSYRALRAYRSSCKLAFARGRKQLHFGAGRFNRKLPTGFVLPFISSVNKIMTFQAWIFPLLDHFPYERTIYQDYIRPNKHGTFSVRNAPEAQAKLRVSARYLYKVRDRLESLARLYEALVENGVIE
jgi:hypothetical protein